jgi:hypothetical protein
VCVALSVVFSDIEVMKENYCVSIIITLTAVTFASICICISFVVMLSHCRSLLGDFPHLTLFSSLFSFVYPDFRSHYPIFFLFAHILFDLFIYFRATLPLLQMASEFLKYVPIMSSLPSYAINMLSYLNRSHFRSSSSS